MALCHIGFVPGIGKLPTQGLDTLLHIFEATCGLLMILGVERRGDEQADQDDAPRARSVHGDAGLPVLDQRSPGHFRRNIQGHHGQQGRGDV